MTEWAKLQRAGWPRLKAPPDWAALHRLGPAIRAAGLIALVALALATPGFTAPPSVLSFINTAALVGCVAVGMTFVTLSGNIMSFSLGATMGATAVAYASLSDGGVVPALAAALALAVAMNLAQGLLVGFFRANPIIVTIAALALIGGFADLITGGRTIYITHGSLFFLKGKVAGIPVAGLVFLGCAIAGQLLLRYTQFGQNVMMVGSNIRAATAAGVRTWRTVAAAYAWAGLFSGIAGLLVAARYDAGHMEYGAGYDYSAIAGVLVGGTAIHGGQGSMVRSFVGVLVMAAISVILLLRGFETQYQHFITGLMVLAAVMLQARARA